MSDYEVYGGIVLAGIAIGGTIGPSVIAVHHRLEAEVGDMPRWADALALVGGYAAAVVLAAACGAVLGWRSDALGHDYYVGAVWGLVGGIIGPSMWSSVRELAVDALRRKANV